jgi:hypothetical protein
MQRHWLGGHWGCFWNQYWCTKGESCMHQISDLLWGTWQGRVSASPPVIFLLRWQVCKYLLTKLLLCIWVCKMCGSSGLWWEWDICSATSLQKSSFCRVLFTNSSVELMRWCYMTLQVSKVLRATEARIQPGQEQARTHVWGTIVLQKCSGIVNGSVLPYVN